MKLPWSICATYHLTGYTQLIRRKHESFWTLHVYQFLYDKSLNFRYEAVYSKDIPEIITGDAFLEKYGDHNDMVTVIDPKRPYGVKAPTRHPIYENFRVEV